VGRNAVRVKAVVFFIVILLMLASSPQMGRAENSHPFPDVSGAEYFSDAAERLHHADIFIGDADGKLNADEPFTRAQMAVVLTRITGEESVARTLSSDMTTWADDAEIPEWARGAFVLSQMREWFVGRDDGTVGPNEYLSWAEISILLARVTDNEHLARGEWPSNALVAGQTMQLYDAIPHTPQADLPILRGQMVVAVWNAILTPSALGTEEEGAELLGVHHSATAQKYLSTEETEESHVEASGRIVVRVHLSDAQTNVPVRVKLGDQTQSLTTTVEGRAEYAFTDLAFGEYDVAADADGYEKAGDTIILAEAEPSAHITLSLPEEAPEAIDASLSTEEVAEIAIPATVTIAGDAGGGSGFHIGQGMVVTNHHVVDGSRSLDVISHDEQEYQVTGVYAYDIALDIAILAVPRLDIPALEFSEEEVRVGEDVVAVGSPLGIFDSTVTSGIISARRDSPDLFTAPLLQSTASLNPGNSGGPLLNKQGQVIGVNTFKVEDAEGLNFAVPIGVVQPVVAEARRQTRPSPIEDALDDTLSIGELDSWLEEMIQDSVFWGSQVWISDQGDAVLFSMITDSDGCEIILDMAEDPEYRSDFEYLLYLVASHIHANTDMVVYGGISCIETWWSFPDILYDAGWEVWESDGQWFSRLPILNIHFRGEFDYDHQWLP